VIKTKEEHSLPFHCRGVGKNETEFVKKRNFIWKGGKGGGNSTHSDVSPVGHQKTGCARIPVFHRERKKSGDSGREGKVRKKKY